MGIVSWARSRFNGKTECRGFELAGKERRQVVPEEEEKHLTDEQQRCLHQDQASLLSIGTFGGTENPAPDEDDDLPEFTMEEAKKLQHALAKLLRRARSKHSARGFDAGAESTSGLPLDRFLNCPSSLEVDRRVQRKREDGDGDGENDGDLSPSTKIILSMAKDLLVNTSGAGIKNKSFKFLLKKMFVCGGAGFAPTPTLKVPTETRMDKFFRTILSKTVNFRPPTNGAASRSCFLEPDRSKEMSRGGQSRREEEEGNSCRWDRTDSEFIVLEI